MQACEAVVAMGSLLEELARRQAEARQPVEELGQQLAEVRARLEAEEDRLSRLLIAQEVVEEILGGEGRLAADPVPDGGDAVAAVTRQKGQDSDAEVVRRGVVTVPPWHGGLEPSVLPRAYRDVLEVLADAGRAVRAGKISAALGRGESAVAVEGLRGKLRRLVERGWLTQDEPGLFALTEQVHRQVAQ
ncbi:hypothetical protein ACIBI9_46010 [Nonomuraea sp. NPDC050451]|uniref:hypothetical protein n=1 Tax=Nonomuraea sp. NPDC050451 TaxID=3364364 RepID=UPI00378FF126